jgi:hypothetical protein
MSTINRHEMDEFVLSALNVEKLVGKSSTEVKTVLVFPGGKIGITASVVKTLFPR